MSNSQTTTAKRFPKSLWLVAVVLVLMVVAAIVAFAVVVVPRSVAQLPEFSDKMQMRASLATTLMEDLKSPDSVASSVNCQCVTYVVKKLFGGPRPGNWPTAASMATNNYWGQERVVGSNGKRSRSNAAQRGDVIIMQPYATVYPWNERAGQFDELTNVGYGDGHIGFVVMAEYYNEYKGWLILMRSANWSSNWAVNELSDGGCSNVSDSFVFIPNGDAVSFWRK